MDNLGITDQKARDLVEDEVMSYFKDNWSKTVANDNDNDLFAMHFDYTTSNTNTGAQAQFNGNISQITWRVRGDAHKSVYGFQYDDLNRLKEATYKEYDDNMVYSNIVDYSVSGIKYDLNGNIKELNRMGFDGTGYSQIDQMVYTYQSNSNILQSIADGADDGHGFKETNQSGTDYLYDANGNMTNDYNKGVAVTYNHMNLPMQAQLSNGRIITWIYDAAGVKLTKSTVDGLNNTTEKQYVGGIEYIKTGTTYTVEAIYHSEGRLTPKNDSYQYEYTLRDHLGNARVTFTDIENDGVVDETDILQTNHYYPFGMVMEGNQVPQQGITNNYQYNGKELNTDFGLDWLDYGARWYDPSIARWSAVDPLAEQYMAFSQYNYVRNNPIMLIDPDGRSDRPAITTQQLMDNIMAGMESSGSKNMTFTMPENGFGEESEEFIGDLNVVLMPTKRDAALEKMYKAAKKTTATIIEAKTPGDAASKLEKLVEKKGQKIDNLIIGSHGNYKNGYRFKIGNTKYSTLGGVSKGSNLDKIFQTVDEDGLIMIQACHAGQTANGGEAIIKKMATTYGRKVIANKSWGLVNDNLMFGFPLIHSLQASSRKPGKEMNGSTYSYEKRKHAYNSVNNLILAKPDGTVEQITDVWYSKLGAIRFSYKGNFETVLDGQYLY